jgi:hypothetical protein
MAMIAYPHTYLQIKIRTVDNFQGENSSLNGKALEY